MVLGLRKTLHIIFLFQYGREHIEIARKERHGTHVKSDDCDEDGGKGQGDKKESVSKNVSSHSVNNSNNALQKPDKALRNGMLGNSTTSLISREDLILLPDPEQNYKSANNNLDSEGDHPAVEHVSKQLLQNIFVITRLLAVAAANDATCSAALSPAIKILSVGFHNFQVRLPHCVQ
jgi:hypothetical protein